jgi:nucleoside 2-deoxyribosyltransferase
LSSIFFGYPQSPRSQAEVIYRTATNLKSELGVRTVLWEEMETDGRVIVDRLLEQIDSSDRCVFDLTSTSENVLFEAGYAIARGKVVWLAIDQTDTRSRQKWDELGLLKPVGYTAYKNSDELCNQILAQYDTQRCSYSAGVRAGGSQAPVVKSCWSAWSLSIPHLVAVSR